MSKTYELGGFEALVGPSVAYKWSKLHTIELQFILETDYDHISKIMFLNTTHSKYLMK